MQVLTQPTQHSQNVETLDAETLQISSNESTRTDRIEAIADIPLVDPLLERKFSPPSSGLVSFPVGSLRAVQFRALAAAAFLVAVPVFVQAPLVRAWPMVGLITTGGWLMLGKRLLDRPRTQLWGDLVVGFSWTWLAGAIYWGWFRWNPYLHLPIESVGLLAVLPLLYYGKAKIGNYFYLGSLLGTAITDLYFYCVGLIPYWKQLMGNPDEASSILHSALLRMETYQGVGAAIVLLSLLVMLGTVPLRSLSVKWWAFSGAVLSTILVDSLFFVAAVLS